ncbi:Hypothetical protein BQ3484_114 [Cedratvirus A11]|uniref:Uncharacterized protein n=1 Tax=Cedratvirus A11 TaxID=1903266 RepID=A0A1M7XU25_9VIRU|nr:Hypothetical protein BQ3484_114 [Cedratvirus A11]SHO33182.1 Hypothetical protein BQ3484_114 [Cedratvirus A11]
MEIAKTPLQVRMLLSKEFTVKENIKVAPLKTVLFRIPSPMEALKTISNLPLIEEEAYLENQRSEDQDFYDLRIAFANLVQERLETNRITALILGEVFAKKVLYGVKYSNDIENVIALVTSEL